MKKIIILIFTYDRFNSLINLINELSTQTTKHKFEIIVCDDCSPSQEYLNSDYFKNNNIEIIRTNENNGKKGYWKTVNYAFNHIKNINFDYLMQLDDDYEICDNFIDLSIDFFNKQIDTNNSYVAMSLHLNGNQDGITNRWKCGNSWVDGGAIYTNDIINKLNFKINEISEKRWAKNNKLSSGVWQQVSTRINTLGFIIIKPTHSFLNHNDGNLSKMNFDLNRVILSYNFIGNNKNLELNIYNPIIVNTYSIVNKKKSSEGTSGGNTKQTPKPTQAITTSPIVIENPIPKQSPKPTQAIITSPIVTEKPKIQKEDNSKPNEKPKGIHKVNSDIFMGKAYKKKLRFGKK